MANLLPHLVDMPMSIGDHLHELRRRLMMPIIMLGVFFIGAFYFQAQLKVIFLKPVVWAIQMYPKNAELVGLPTDGSTRFLHAFGFSESAMVSMSVSFYTALFLTIPVLVYQIWKFVSTGLLPKEQRLAFLFVPAGILFFYAGTLVGYFFGLPFYYAWLIEWTAHDPTSTFTLRQYEYQDSFVLMTICFGLIADIPWLVMVLVRVGFVTPATLARHRKIVIMVNVVVASLITPPDGGSMLAMILPLQLLFELGLVLSRLMLWYGRRLALSEAANQPDGHTPDDHHG
jgi:sec-independent protein translocase protein TatC